MKIATILGTRPELIRLSCIIPELDRNFDHTLIHTGQNYDHSLKDVFFEQLGIRQPDHYLGIQEPNFAAQVAEILRKSYDLLTEIEPDRLLILGDTNSALSVIVAKRLGIPVIHMEAGNRCYDDRVPEEVNRRIIDHSSDVLLPYTRNSERNLLREGIAGNRIYVTGNPIYEVLKSYEEQIAASTVLKDRHLTKKDYFLTTLHREENVDNERRLRKAVNAMARVVEVFKKKMHVSTHPRTQQRLKDFGILAPDMVHFLEPSGFFDFITLEKNAFCVLSDSGTVQEECCILRIPNVTMRDSTERPETLECGSNILCGVEPKQVERAVTIAISGRCDWTPPSEYLVPNVSQTVIRIMAGNLQASS